MDHIEKQTRVSELRDLVSRIEPYLELVSTMLAEKATAVNYTTEEIESFSAEELDETYNLIAKMERAATNLWLGLTGNLRTLRSIKTIRDGKNFSARVQSEYTTAPAKATDIEIETLSDEKQKELLELLIARLKK